MIETSMVKVFTNTMQNLTLKNLVDQRSCRKMGGWEKDV